MHHLQPHPIDLWYVLLDKATDLALKSEYRELMSRDEIEREQRYVPEESRHQCVVSRALVRTALSYYADAHPREWLFEFNSYGKPSIAHPVGLGWEFNLSHTRGLAVCAVSQGCAVGVDVEWCDKKVDYLGLAGRFFHAAEAATLGELPPERQPERFFQYWTLKESYIKACGKGLSIPLGGFAFSLAPDHPPRITWTTQHEEPAGTWHFGQLRVGSGYEIALAACLPAGRTLQVRVRETIPLRWQQPWQALANGGANRWVLG